MKKILLVLVIAGVAAFSFFYLKNGNVPSVANGTGNKTILFYGIGCPHCKIVDDFIAENKIVEKIQFEHLEVFSNRSNSKLLEEKAAECKLDKNNLGVPLLWDNGKCYSGDKEIIDFFKNKLNDNQ